MGDLILKYLEITAEAAGFAKPKSPIAIIAALIAIALSFLGIIFLCLIIYAGFLWMTAGGNEQKIYKAKKILINSTIGVFIILSAYSISHFVLNALIKATG